MILKNQVRVVNKLSRLHIVFLTHSLVYILEVSNVANEVRSAAERFAAATGNNAFEETFRSSGNASSGHSDGNSGSNQNSESDMPLESLTTVKLPDGLSLFGLVSMHAKQAVDLIETHNKDFKVIVVSVHCYLVPADDNTLMQWPAEDSFESIREDKVVRLLVNKNDIVVDVWRF